MRCADDTRGAGHTRLPIATVGPMLQLDGSPLQIEDVIAVARDGRAVSVADAARARMAPSRRVVEEIDRTGAVAYGLIHRASAPGCPVEIYFVVSPTP